MVAITGNDGTSYIGKDAFQEVYITGITMPITKHNFFVSDIKELAPVSYTHLDVYKRQMLR